MKFVLWGACLNACLSATAWASCPVAADLDKGIILTVNAKERETIRRMSDGVLVSDYEVDGADVSQVLLGQGVYLLQLMDIVDGKPVPSSRSTYAYPMLPTDMPIPTPNGGWSAEYLHKGTEGQSVEFVFGDLTQMTLGECSYDMIPIDAVYQPTGDHEVLHYFPELGLSYLAGFYDNGKLDSFAYIGIQKVE